MGGVDRPIFLVGFMASGKTTAGRLLAASLGLDFADTDASIERGERRSIEHIFADRGEAHFRRLEWEALRTIGPGSPRVVATGGGAFLAALPRRWMKQHGLTVWLDVELDEIRRRVRGAGGRPLWPGEEGLALRVLFERRRAAYALAQLRVVASPGDAQEVAERIRARTVPFFR